MARNAIPDPLSRRHLIERDLDAAQAGAIAEAYLREGRTVEALIFLVKAGDEERTQTLRDRAVESGDAFLLKEICRVSGRDEPSEVWTALADHAEAAGKERYARVARRQASR